MIMNKSIEFLKANESAIPSKFEEKAQWRRENRQWLLWSRHISVSLIAYMEKNKLNRVGLAERLDVTPQYVSKLLSGSVNFSFKSVAELETKLGVQFLDIVEPAI